MLPPVVARGPAHSIRRARPRLTPFGSLTIQHHPSVLQPRPWTLMQSDWAVELSGTLADGAVLELCCGAGHIGLETARRTGRPLVQVDLNATACHDAVRNARRAGIAQRVRVRCGAADDVVDVHERFPLVLCDPPYIPTSDVGMFPDDPRMAIDGGDDGLVVLGRCLDLIGTVLEPGGVALVQVRGARQARAVERLVAHGPLDVHSVRSHDADRAVVELRPTASREDHRPKQLVHTDDRPLHEALEAALAAGPETGWNGVIGRDPVDERDALLALAQIHELWTAPVDRLGDRVRLQLHPTVVDLKARLEAAYLDRLRSAEDRGEWGSGSDVAAAIRQVAAVDLVPDAYRWLADEATWTQVVAFLALEGGPDAGFDDLVAIAQVGLSGLPKLTLARNYWDEMGRGALSEVHTALHDRMAVATDMPRIARTDMPVAGLRRMALCDVLATNRSLQPELLGALGLIELLAGPRCRAVARALQRVGAPEGAAPFYEEHAAADPMHGKDWLDEALVPLVEERPDWAPRIVTGARWRHLANEAFFAAARSYIEPAATPDSHRTRQPTGGHHVRHQRSVSDARLPHRGVVRVE